METGGRDQTKAWVAQSSAAAVDGGEFCVPNGIETSPLYLLYPVNIKYQASVGQTKEEG